MWMAFTKHSSTIVHPPSKYHVNLILRALSTTGDISSTTACLLLQENIEEWFKDEELRPILQGNFM
jgi:hypothetical protein